ncbi:hypothetical protein [Mycetocola spongiae]|uniref:hypothetical protein n=1 Tax=Mycetocola spongiae TaxID=2859226 RepID=UPI001CF0DDBA|nr:hypothetical protein [Mycetocola spongiae]UCR89932.1 hypothetical protein KXZ72_04480 [Mycetocola spongiae]
MEESMTGEWNGREWQDYCVLLLQKRYAMLNAHSLQLVPDRHQGDLGIEAFAHDGIAYQCYAAEEPLSVNERYEKQRGKLTADLGKLLSNQALLATMLGSISIHRYVFIVHRHDSRKLIAHAATKAAEVRGWGLSFISDEFSIVVETADDYAVERTAIHAIPAPLIQTPVIAGGVKDEWSAQNQDLRSTARRKLSKVTSSSSKRERVLESLTSQYLQGENTLDRLRAVVPEVHRGILSTKAHREDLLVLEYLTGQDTSQAKLAEIAKDFSVLLREDYPVLTEQIATTLAWSAVADWLMRCPLDF